MSSYDDRELQSLLTPDDRPVPPSDLAERIKAEIPADLAFAPPQDVVVERVSRLGWRRRGWLLAASLVTVLGGVWLAGRTMTEMPVAGRADSRDELSVAAGVRVDVPEIESVMRDPVSPIPDQASQEQSVPVRPLVIAEEAEAPAVEPRDTERPSINAATTAMEHKRPVAPPAEAGIESGVPPETAGPSAREKAMNEAGRLARSLAQAQAQVQAQRTLSARTAAASPRVEEPGSTRSPGAETSPNESFADETQVSAWSSLAGDASGRSGEVFGVPPSVQVATMMRDGVTERAKRALPTQGNRLRVATVVQPRSSFPLVVDTASYFLVRGLVGEGTWPSPDVVRVNAMVNRFDYGDAPPSGEDFALYAEGTPLPSGAENAGRVLLRFGKRARASNADTPEGQVIATVARAWVAFNPAVVARYRLLGGDDRRTNEGRSVATLGAIQTGHGVTALYEIELAPNVAAEPGWRDDVAMLHLDWKAAATGVKESRSRRMTGEDVADDWSGASAPLRWSVLVARLAETLQRGRTDAAVMALRTETERLSPLLFHHPGFVEFRSLVERVGRLPH